MRPSPGRLGSITEGDDIDWLNVLMLLLPTFRCRACGSCGARPDACELLRSIGEDASGRGAGLPMEGEVEESLICKAAASLTASRRFSWLAADCSGMVGAKYREVDSESFVPGATLLLLLC